MTQIIDDRILESTTTTGGGPLTLAGALVGFRRFNAVCAIGDTVPYFIEAIDSLGQPSGDYEFGIGTYSAANQLTRTTIQGSSNGGLAVNFAAGTKNVGLTILTSAFKAKAPLDSPALTGTPVAPNAALNTRGTRVATMESFDTEFVKALGSNGYQKLPGGLILQWGQSGAVGAGAGLVVTLPIAFPSACVNVQLTYVNTAAFAPTFGNPNQVYVLTPSQFGIFNGGAGAAEYLYMAIGY